MSVPVTASEGDPTQGLVLVCDDEGKPIGSRDSFECEIWECTGVVSDDDKQYAILIEVPWGAQVVVDDPWHFDYQALLCPLRALFEDYFAHGYEQNHFADIDQLEALFRWGLEQIAAVRVVREQNGPHDKCCP